MHVVCDESGYLGDEVLVPWVVGGDDGEDVPVVLLHDVEHDGRLLLDGGPELKEHGAVVLKTHGGRASAPTEALCGVNLAAFILSPQRGGERTPVG